MLPSTVGIHEIAWVLICLWGARHHAALWHQIDRDIDLLQAGALPSSPGALALFRNDSDNEFDWMLVKLVLALIGIVAFTQPSAPLNGRGFITVAMLFGVVMWARWRSEVRGRRRYRIIRGDVTHGRNHR